MSRVREDLREQMTFRQLLVYCLRVKHVSDGIFPSFSSDYVATLCFQSVVLKFVQKPIRLEI